MVESYHDNIHKPFETLPLLATASNKAIFCRWGAIVTQLNPMNADTALTKAVSVGMFLEQWHWLRTQKLIV